MLAFLDTRDLVELLEKDKPCDPKALNDGLRRGGHRLVISIGAITEISAPLELGSNADSSVSAILTRLEQLPLEYLNEFEVVAGELQAAVAAFASGQEPQYRPRLERRIDLAIAPGGPNRLFIRYGLAETVFELWRTEPQVFGSGRQHASQLQRVLDGDREIKKLPSMKDRFRSTILRHLKTQEIRVRQDFHLDSFVNWLYKEPRRCPGTRLVFDVFQLLVGDRNTPAEASHFADLYHIGCLPHVDAITLDAHMRSYVETATRRLGDDFGTDVFENTAALLAKL